MVYIIKISTSNFSLVVYRNIFNFYILTLYHETLLNLLINSELFCIFLGISHLDNDKHFQIGTI